MDNNTVGVLVEGERSAHSIRHRKAVVLFLGSLHGTQDIANGNSYVSLCEAVCVMYVFVFAAP